MDETAYVIAPSRTGAAFGLAVTREDDGALTLMSNYGRGYRSAHRDYAAQVLGTRAVHCADRLAWMNAHGVRVVLTRWTS